MNRVFLFINTLLLNGFFYGSVGFLPWLNPYLIKENTIDKWIGFHPYSLYIYFSFFFLIFYSFLKTNDKESKELSILIPISAMIASIIYLVFPTTIMGVNQSFEGDKITMFLYNVLNKNDTHMNCLPSLHGAITVMCIYYLIKDKTKLLLTFSYIIWGFSICWSAIAIRQHLVLDIAFGMLYGIVILFLKNDIINLIDNIINKYHEIFKKY